MRASPFDELAEDYDRAFTRSACGVVLRSMVWERLPICFALREHILELGCGTGEDAVRLARAGHRVFATDASEEMIRVAKLKALAAGCAHRIEFRVLSIEALQTLPPELRFDGVFSNFGVVNCVADTRELARQLAARLAPRAPLMFVAMGRHVPWEWLWYLARGDPGRAFRRLNRDGVEWRGLRIRYPTPAELAGQLAPWFTGAHCSALGFALPPSYAAGWLDRWPRSLAALEWIEHATRRFTASLADHFILEAVRA
jgi:SAM-dependent methyltransferase